MYKNTLNISRFPLWLERVRSVATGVPVSYGSYSDGWGVDTKPFRFFSNLLQPSLFDVFL